MKRRETPLALRCWRVASGAEGDLIRSVEAPIPATLLFEMSSIDCEFAEESSPQLASDTIDSFRGLSDISSKEKAL